VHRAKDEFHIQSSGGTVLSEMQTRPKITGLIGEILKAVAFETFEIFQVRGKKHENKSHEE
jgi:hypothetical protein